MEELFVAERVGRRSLELRVGDPKEQDAEDLRQHGEREPEADYAADDGGREQESLGPSDPRPYELADQQKDAQRAKREDNAVYRNVSFGGRGARMCARQAAAEPTTVTTCSGSPARTIGRAKGRPYLRTRPRGLSIAKPSTKRPPGGAPRGVGSGGVGSTSGAP